MNKAARVDMSVEDPKNGRFVGHILDSGTYKETSQTGLFNTTATCSSVFDMSQGVGDTRGFCKFIHASGDSYMTQWTGTCYSAPGTNGDPVDRCGGGWAVVPNVATGRYVGMKAGGNWWGRNLPNGDFDGAWNGHYQK